MKTEYSMQEQIDAKFVIGYGGKYAIDLNNQSPHFGWLFKLGGSGFYSLRKATEFELANAHTQLNQISFFNDCVVAETKND